MPIPPCWRGRIIAALALAWMLALGGCSTLRLSYNQGTTLAWWWLDAQLDFDAEQRPAVRRAIDRWFEWHRATQLTDLADWLADARRMAAGPVSAEQACTHWNGLQQRMLRWYDRVLPDLAGPARALKPAQLEHLAKKQAKDLDKLREEHVQADLAERHKVHLERTVERLERLYGSVSAAQKRQLADALARSPFDAVRWLDERRALARDRLEGLRRIAAERPDDAQVVNALRAFGTDPASSPREPYRVLQQQVVQSGCAIVTAFHQGASDEQRRHLIDKLEGWEADLRALAAPRD